MKVEWVESEKKKLILGRQKAKQHREVTFSKKKRVRISWTTMCSINPMPTCCMLVWKGLQSVHHSSGTCSLFFTEMPCSFRYAPTFWLHVKLVNQVKFSSILFVCLLSAWYTEGRKGNQSVLHNKFTQCAINNTKNCQYRSKIIQTFFHLKPQDNKRRLQERCGSPTRGLKSNMYFYWKSANQPKPLERHDTNLAK